MLVLVLAVALACCGNAGSSLALSFTPAEANSTSTIISNEACPLSYSDALKVAHSAWNKLLAVLSDRVELLAFEDTLLQHFEHKSLRRTLRPLSLIEGTEVSGIHTGDIFLQAVNETDSSVHFVVRLKPLRIRGALRSSEETHLLRCFLVDTAFRFRTHSDNGDTVFGLAKAGHVTHVQVANGDRTETAFGQEVEALLAGAAVTSIMHELQRAARVHNNWEREPARPLQWGNTQVPRSWSDGFRYESRP